MLYKACVELQGGAPCSPQFIKDQAIEDATEYITESATADLLSGGVKKCVETAGYGLDVGSGVNAGIEAVDGILRFSRSDSHDSLGDATTNINGCVSDLLKGIISF